jgi:hypothetical protein
VEVDLIICPLTPYTPHALGGGQLTWSGSIGECYDQETGLAYNVAVLSLQQCLLNLVTGGWRQVGCKPSNDEVYTTDGAAALYGPSTESSCVKNRYYATYAFGAAELANGSYSSNSQNTEKNGTKCT